VARKTEVKVRITGESRSAEAAAKRTEGAFRKFGGYLKSNFVPLIATGLGLRALVGLFRSVTKAAAEQEQAVRNLDAALLPLGDKAGEVSKRLQEQAAALQRVTTAGDEAIIKGQALVATFTQDEEAIKRSTEAALNLSAAVGIDLNAAFLLMGKAADGETSTLSRYGLVLDEGIPKGEKFAAVLELIEGRMGGRAQEAAKTYAGLMSQIGNAFGDLKERVGAALTENEKVTAQLTRLKQILEDEGTVDSVATLAENMVNLAVGTIGATRAISDLLGPLDAINAELAKGNPEIEKSAAAYAEWAKGLREDVKVALDDWLTSVRASLGLLEEWGGGVHRVAMSASDSAETVETLTAAFGSQSEAMKVLIRWQEREKGILDELTASEDKFVEATQRLGIALEADVAAKIEENNKVLELYERRLHLGEISAEDFARAQKAIAAANKELSDSLGTAKDATEESGKALDAYSGGLRDATKETDKLTESTKRNTDALKENERQTQQTARSKNLLGGESAFAQIGPGSFTRWRPNQVVQQADGRLIVTTEGLA
jgi:hypothetical protein